MNRITSVLDELRRLPEFDIPELWHSVRKHWKPPGFRYNHGMTSTLSELLTSLEDSLWLRGRVRVVTDVALDSQQEFVLYWMHNAVRGHENPALDVAILAAERLNLPLLVYHAISESYPFASDRLHTFMLEGARDVQAELREHRIPYVFHLERAGHRGPHLRTLAKRSALLITEEMPVQPLMGWVQSLAATKRTSVWTVDTSCVVPMQLVKKAHTRAFAFRDATRSLYEERLGLEPEGVAAEKSMAVVPSHLPFEPLDLQGVETARLIKDCAIDHAVAPVPHTKGGSLAGYERWNKFKAKGLSAYAKMRNDALTNGVSRMSAYLHFGMVSPFRLAREAAHIGGRGAEKFLDELLIWRELAWVFCFYRPDHDSVSALPEWAVKTLEGHQDDKRSVLFDWETMARGQTGDALWDAAQKSLLIQGELHNNVRMTWGKAILNWTRGPEEALTRMVDLNHRYALDGRDPASYGGLLWCLGQFDRPFKPARRVIGTVRPRPTNEHARRLNVEQYLRKVTRPLLPSMPSVAVIGAGISGLAAARTLADHGFDVSVFDKGRHPGGRMSTRQNRNGFHFDHGAQYFGARDERFRRYVDAWLESGVVRPWPGRIVDLRAGQTTERESGTRFVGVPGMRSVCDHLAHNLSLRQKIRIDELQRTNGWQLYAENQLVGEYDRVVIALPARQAGELISTSPVMADSPVLRECQRVPFNCCWAAMFAFEGTLPFAADGAFVHDSRLAWIARDSSKPERNADHQCWVVHANADWSAQNTELDRASVADILLSDFFEATGLSSQSPTHSVAHLWRYAIPAEPLCDEHLNDPDHHVFVCGDWCLGNRVEAAFLSGISAAGALMRDVLHVPS